MTARRNPQRSAAVALLGASALHLALIASAAVWLAPLFQSHRPDPVLIVALHSATVSTPAAPPHAGSHALPPPVRPQKPQPRRLAPARKPAAPASNLPPATPPSTPAAAPQQPVAQPDPAVPSRAPEATAATAKTGVAIPAAYAAHNRKPEYPLMSRRFNEQGTAVLQVLVTADGSAGDVQIVTSSGHALLDQSALTAVRNWRFVAATQDGKAVSEWYQISIPYTLQD
ncbi:energy transducer TonB [Herminiimonas sp. CN]|uniref:energy transducer TonB n=1 Tax=Herminiimonas sp. CN TaxID=1349818 RepID=UPI000473E503|nr:energy transducer TonB [Herminiimonas sp. CN]